MSTITITLTDSEALVMREALVALRAEVEEFSYLALPCDMTTLAQLEAVCDAVEGKLAPTRAA